METKKCSCCGQVLPIENFYKNNRSKDGYAYTCKECSNKRNKVWREYQKVQIKQQQADYTALKFDVKTAKENALAAATPRDLMKELYRRGYVGTLEYTEVHKVDITRLND